MLSQRILVLLCILAALSGAALTTVLRALVGELRGSLRVRRWTALAGGLLSTSVLLFEPLARRFAPMGGGAWRYVLAAERGFALTLWVSAAALLVLRGFRALWAFRASSTPSRTQLGGAERTQAEPAESLTQGGVPERASLPRRTALASMGVATFGVLRGGLRERHDLELSDVTLSIPDLPPALEGITLVQLSDLHIGLFTGPQELDQMLRVVARARGDIVVLTGDIVDNNPAHISAGMRALAALRAPLGVYGILGNHDHLTGAREVAAGMRSAGIRVLLNDSVRVAPKGREGFTLAGVDDLSAIPFGGGPDLDRALSERNREEPCVLLAHNPALFQEYAGRVAAQLSGHTHGGQINPLGLHLLRIPYLSGKYFERSSVLYVSRGIGITGPPVRLNARPEVVRVALTSRRG